MNFENIELFIKSGIIAHEKQQYKSFLAGSGIVGILGSAVASFLEQPASMFSIVPIVISIVSIVGVFLLSEKTLSNVESLVKVEDNNGKNTKNWCPVSTSSKL